MKSKTLNEGQTPEEKFLAIGKLTQRIEQSFIELGELLTGIKRAKLYRLKGFESFKNFVEAEYSFSSGLANKLVRLYEIFVEGMDQDAETLNGIGFDRLMTIAPVVEKADWEKREELMEMAADQPLPELFESLKKMKEEAQAKFEREVSNADR